MRVQRWEPIEIKADGKLKRDAAGFLKLPVFATRVGVLDYLRSDGSVVREGRMPQEVFDPASMDTIKGIPVTNNHPVEGLVSSRNAREHMRGFTMDVAKKADNRFLATELKITDEDTIRDIMAGKVEVSMGYTVERDETPGEIDGENFDVQQKNIRYNHLAIVDRGRAGPEVRLRLDSDDNQVLSDGGDMKTKKIKIVLDGKEKEIEVDETVADSIEKLSTDNVAMQAELEKKKAADKKVPKKDGQEDVEKLKAENETLKKDADKVQAKLDAVVEENAKLKEGSPKTDSKAVSEAVRVRLKTEKVARKVLDEKESEKIDSMSDEEIKLAVLKADSKTFEPEGKSETYIDARFDLVAERVLASNEDEMRDLGKRFINDSKKGAEVPDLDKARADAHERGLSAWKQPLSISADKAN